MNDTVFKSQRHTMGRFFSMLWKGKLPYLWILGYIAASAFLTNVGISTTEYTAKLFAGDVGFSSVVLPFLIFQLISLAIGTVSGILCDLCMARIDRNLRRMIWKKIVSLPMSYYGKSEPKELISRVTTDIETISSLVMKVFVSLITTGYTLFATLAKIGTYDRELMYSLFAVFPLIIAIAVILGRLHFGVRDTVNLRNAELTETVAESVGNGLLIKSMGTQSREEARGVKRMEALYRGNIASMWVDQASFPLYAIAGMMQFIVIVLVGRGFYSGGALSLAQWIAYYGFANTIVNTLSSYGGEWATFKASQGATNRVSGLMQELEEEIEKGQTAEKLSGDIVFEKVSFSYGEEPLFRDLSLTIPEGKVTAIVGSSGSGKTTVLNLIGRLYEPSEGEIRIGDAKAGAFSLKSYRSLLGYATQESRMVSGSIRDNLLSGVKRNVSEEELLKVCEAVQLTELIRNGKDGLDTQVGEGGGLLSGGQKQRIAIARMLLKKPDYLLLDESTAAIDIDGKDKVWQSLKSCMKGKTVVYVAHDRQTMSHADHLVVMENGAVMDSGSREELLKRNAYVRELLGEDANEKEK